MCVFVSELLRMGRFMSIPFVLPLQQQQAESYGGPPPSPVVAANWSDRAAYVDEAYMRQDPTILPGGAGTPIASTNSGNGDTGFMVSGG